ncbi:PH domain-containing protein [Bacillus sp. FSL R12-0069]|uniref:PH domain-containing protein n=1 Tax=Bacillus sp. FSL R12-0069 TaxID=2975342 RepID=UPI0030F75FE1
MNYTNDQNHQIKRLHPFWLILKLGKSIQEIIFISIFFTVILNLNSNNMFIEYKNILIVLFIMYKLISIILEWKNFRYYLTEKELFVRNGRFIKVERHIPLKNITSLNQNTNFYHRLFGVTSLLLDIGANEKESFVKLDMITHIEANNIKQHLNNYGVISMEELGEYETNIECPIKQINDYKISSKELIIGSITSLKPIFFCTFLYSIYSHVEEYFLLDNYLDSIISVFTSSWYIETLGVILLLILSLIYGIIKNYLQYGDFSVASDNNQIYIQKGKINITEFSIQKDQIQAIIISSSFFKKITGLVRVKVLSTHDKDVEDMKTSSILFPFIQEEELKKLLPKLLPNFKINENMHQIPKSSIVVKLLRVIPTCVFFSIIIFLYEPDFMYIASSIFLIVIITQIFNGIFTKYLLTQKSLYIKTYFLYSKLVITNNSKIEELKIVETLLQRKLRISSCMVIFRANPVKTIKIQDIPQSIINSYCQTYLKNLSSGESKKKC